MTLIYNVFSGWEHDRQLQFRWHNSAMAAALVAPQIREHVFPLPLCLTQRHSAQALRTVVQNV
jgi:hypothetical protein